MNNNDFVLQDPNNSKTCTLKLLFFFVSTTFYNKDQTTFSTHHILHLPLASPQLVPQKLCRFGECLSILFATSEVSPSDPPEASSIVSNISLILQLNPP